MTLRERLNVVLIIFGTLFIALVSFAIIEATSECKPQIAKDNCAEMDMFFESLSSNEVSLGYTRFTCFDEVNHKLREYDFSVDELRRC